MRKGNSGSNRMIDRFDHVLAALKSLGHCGAAVVPRSPRWPSQQLSDLRSSRCDITVLGTLTHAGEGR